MSHASSLLSLVFLLSGTFSFAAEVSPHPVAERLIRDGFAIAEGQTQKLPPPIVRANMTADEQRRSLESLVGKTRMPQFLRNSQVARHQLKVPTLGKLADGATVRGLDLAFVVYADLKQVQDQQFGDPSAKPDDGGFETYFEPLEQPPEDADAIEWAKTPRLYRYRFPLIDKVIVSGLLEGQAVVEDEVVVQTIISPVDRLQDETAPTVWRAIPRGAKTDAQLGAPGPFRGVAGYLQATQLKFQPGAVLVEVHTVYVEPEGWFGGRNLLASKLPIALQDSVRKFRRALAKQGEP